MRPSRSSFQSFSPTVGAESPAEPLHERQRDCLRRTTRIDTVDAELYKMELPCHKGIAVVDSNLEETVIQHPMPKRTRNSSILSLAPREQRLSESSLLSYDSSMTTVAVASSPATPHEHPTSAFIAKESPIEATRLTERPKLQPLFQYIDWEGRVRPTRVKQPPPVSFNRYLRDQHSQGLATTDVAIDPTTGKTIENPTCEHTNESCQCIKDDEKPCNPADGLKTPRSMSAQVSKAELLQEDQNAAVSGAFSSLPSTATTFKRPQTPYPLRDRSNASTLVDGSHDGKESDATTDSPSSVRTDKLPSVTEPGMYAYYAQYLNAAFSLPGAPTGPMAYRPVGSAPLSQTTARHEHGTSTVSSPDVFKPLPQIPTMNPASTRVDSGMGDGAARLHQGSRSPDEPCSRIMKVGETPFTAARTTGSSLLKGHTDTQSSSSTLVHSSFSDFDSDSDDDLTGVKIKEINPKMFGRHKYKHMRKGMPGWEQYVQQMLSESQGKPKPANVSGQKGNSRGRSLFSKWITRKGTSRSVH